MEKEKVKPKKMYDSSEPPMEKLRKQTVGSSPPLSFIPGYFVGGPTISDSVFLPCRTSRTSLRPVVAVTRRRLPSVHPVKCSAAPESAFTRNGGAMATPTARTAATKPTVVSAGQLSTLVYI